MLACAPSCLPTAEALPPKLVLQAFIQASNLTAVLDYFPAEILPHAKLTTIQHLVRDFAIAGVDTNTGAGGTWPLPALHHQFVALAQAYCRECGLPARL